jgi:hypothetical protein
VVSEVRDNCWRIDNQRLIKAQEPGWRVFLHRTHEFTQRRTEAYLAEPKQKEEARGASGSPLHSGKGHRS